MWCSRHRQKLAAFTTCKRKDLEHYPPDRFSVSHSLLSKFTHPSTPAQSLADCRGVPSTELSWQSGLAPGETKGDRFSKSLFIEALEGRPHSLSREKSAPHPFFRCSTFARSHRFILTTRSSRRTNSRLLRCSSSFSLELSTFQIAVEDSEFELRTESGRWRILFFFFIILWRTCTVETEVAAVEAGSISDV